MNSVYCLQGIAEPMMFYYKRTKDLLFSLVNMFSSGIDKNKHNLISCLASEPSLDTEWTVKAHNAPQACRCAVVLIWVFLL